MKSYVVKIHVFRYFSISRHSRRWEFPKTRFVEPVTLRRGVTMLPCAWKLTWIQIQGHAQIRNWCAAASGLRVLVMLVSLGLFPQAIDKNLKLFSIALKTSLSVSLTLLSLLVVLLTRTEVGRPSIVYLLFFSRHAGSRNFRKAVSFETQLAVVCQKVFIPFVQSFRDFHNFTFLFSL